MRTSPPNKAFRDLIRRASPVFGEAGFQCAHCRVFSQQAWWSVRLQPDEVPPDNARAGSATQIEIDALASAIEAPDRPTFRAKNIRMSECYVCKDLTIWLGDTFIWPAAVGDIPRPSVDMPADVKADFEEAASIFAKSPRAAAALLRLALEKLCRHFGKKGDVNKMIGELVKDGLSPKLQRAFDFVRVMGNEAVHPGTIDIDDNAEVVATLFRLLNLIVAQMITEGRQIDAVYATIPPEKLAAIRERDKPKK